MSKHYLPVVLRTRAVKIDSGKIYRKKVLPLQDVLSGKSTPMLFSVCDFGERVDNFQGVDWLNRNVFLSGFGNSVNNPLFVSMPFHFCSWGIVSCKCK